MYIPMEHAETLRGSQKYLDLIHRFVHRRLDRYTFWTQLRGMWGREREVVWQTIWVRPKIADCGTQGQIGDTEEACTTPDSYRLPRLLDRLLRLFGRYREEEGLREAVRALLAEYSGKPFACAEPGVSLNRPAPIAVFARPLPVGERLVYPCTVADIDRQLVHVPEYDLEGLWAIGLSPAGRVDTDAYGAYYYRKWPVRKSVILLYSEPRSLMFKMQRRPSPGWIERWHRVELEYGMEIERKGSRAICHWPAESLRRYSVEHVLLHEIGHHVQYQQRWRAGLKQNLTRRVKEQFAEDYALRFHREHRR